MPYVLVGVCIGEVLKRSRWLRIVRRSNLTHGFMSIFIAAAAGIISPLCTYGTIPIVLQLYRAGMPLPPLLTFLSTSSLMNPQVFILTWGGIGPAMALARLAAVLLFGMMLGGVLRILSMGSVLNRVVPDLSSTPENSHHDFQEKESPGQSFFSDFWKSLQFVGFYVILGILVGAVIEVFVPGRWIYALFRPSRWFSVPLAAILGIPLYACGGGAIPMIRSLLFQGMGRGAALAFFLVGPATRAAPIMAMLTVVRPVFLGVYVAVLVIYSLLSGFIYEYGILSM